MKVKAANGFARILKSEGIPWVSCYPTNHVVTRSRGGRSHPHDGRGALRRRRADAFSRATAGKQIGVCTVMANLNAAGIDGDGAIGQAWEDSSPLLVITEGARRAQPWHTHYDMAEALSRSPNGWARSIA